MNDFKAILRHAIQQKAVILQIRLGKLPQLMLVSGPSALNKMKETTAEQLEHYFSALFPKDINKIKSGLPAKGALNVVNFGDMKLIAEPKLGKITGFLPPHGEKVYRDTWQKITEALPHSKQTTPPPNHLMTTSPRDQLSQPSQPHIKPPPPSMSQSEPPSSDHLAETVFNPTAQTTGSELDKPLAKTSSTHKSNSIEDYSSIFSLESHSPPSDDPQQLSHDTPNSLNSITESTSKLPIDSEQGSDPIDFMAAFAPNIRPETTKEPILGIEDLLDQKGHSQELPGLMSLSEDFESSDTSTFTFDPAIKLPPTPGSTYSPAHSDDQSELERVDDEPATSPARANIWDFSQQIQDSYQDSNDEVKSSLGGFEAHSNSLDEEQPQPFTLGHLKPIREEARPSQIEIEQSPTFADQAYPPDTIEQKPSAALPTSNPEAPQSTITFGANVPGNSSPVGDFPINGILEQMLVAGASDLHLTVGQPIMLRIDGDIVKADQAVDDDAMSTYLLPIMPEINQNEFAKCNDTDFAYDLPGKGRFRVNIFRDRNGVGAVLRQIPTKIPSADDLKLTPPIRRFCHLSKGLVLVTGPTGSGKSTTLAAMIDLINSTRSEHIITIEDPIEFVHPPKKCLVNQREVRAHTDSFSKALRAALREDPDIVLVGEIRDLETMEIALETAETGHLVFGTLHTTTAVSTIDRVIDQFPEGQQNQVRMMLANSLRGVISQVLLKKIGGGRVAAQEIMVVSKSISAQIRDAKIHMIPNDMQTKKQEGNMLMAEALLALITSGTVSSDEAIKKASDPDEFKAFLKTRGIAA